jgi:MtN3 and saliva related transmembrane protein
LTTFVTLSAGVGLWVFYCVLKNDFVIIIANAVTLTLLMGILYMKLRERLAPA